jgi:sensor domain CHASE-containing protein
MYAIAAFGFLNNLTQIEAQTTAEKLEQVNSTINNRLSALSATAGDYARWDDTYQFAQDGNSDYITANFLPATFEGLRLNLFAILDREGHLVYGQVFDLETSTSQDLTTRFEVQLQSQGRSLLTHTDLDSTHTGLFSVPEGTMLVASRPILTSNGDGPIQGSLIMGRYLSGEEVAQLEHFTHLAITVYDMQRPMPPTAQDAVEPLESGELTVVQPLNTEAIAGYTLLADVNGDLHYLLLRHLDAFSTKGW